MPVSKEELLEAMRRGMQRYHASKTTLGRGIYVWGNHLTIEGNISRVPASTLQRIFAEHGYNVRVEQGPFHAIDVYTDLGRILSVEHRAAKIYIDLKRLKAHVANKNLEEHPLVRALVRVLMEHGAVRPEEG